MSRSAPLVEAATRPISSVLPDAGELAATVLEEPLLRFGDGGVHADPKHGLGLFGPPGLPDQPDAGPGRVRVGVIGDREGVFAARSWLDTLAGQVAADASRPSLHPEYPGFDAVFGCELKTADRWTWVLEETRVQQVVERPSFQQRLDGALELFTEAMENIQGTPSPDVAIFVYPDSMLEPLGVEGGRGNTAKLTSREKVQRDALLEHQETGQQRLVPFDEDQKARLLDREMTDEFYKRLKLASMQLELPLQISKRETFTGEANRQPEPTCAWNYAVALYYKAGGYPWRPVEAPADVCHLGVSFYRDEEEDGVHTAVAQLFTPTGEGLVVEGASFRWDRFPRNSPHLTTEQAASLLGKALSVYEQHMGQGPRRLVVHKTSPYWDEELEGFKQRSASVPSADLLSLRSARARLLRLGEEPPLRGTMVKLDRGHYLLYTKGYVPFLRCYPGPYVPAPLEVTEHHGDGSPRKVCREILWLSKMNWNNANYGGKWPITLTLSRDVGDILKARPDGPGFEPPESFLWYM